MASGSLVLYNTWYKKPHFYRQVLALEPMTTNKVTLEMAFMDFEE